MQITDFTYKLPDELIALQPPSIRGQSRLLVLDRRTGQIEHRRYPNFADYIKPGDLVILNDTKVIKARLQAVTNAGKQLELLLLEDHHNTDFSRRKCIYKGKLRIDEILSVGHVRLTVTKVEEGGIAEVSGNVNLLDLAEHQGTVPLPPYMHRDATDADIERYQTIFAQNAGSVAAPTASLNITKELLAAIVAKDATVAYLTLHVGLGTFMPIRTVDIEQHHMHSEYFEIPAPTLEAIRQTKAAGGRVFAVGTTVARTLEYAHAQIISADATVTGEADIFIYPGYEFQLVDRLLTNFHAPKSTVLMLAAAFAGWDHLANAYQAAIDEKYAFLSYGDSMLIT